jgi:hypothetical protein
VRRVTISREGDWWHGSDSADLDAFLTAATADSYPVSDVRHARCRGCGGTVFQVAADDTDGYVERTCTGCGDRFLMLDSADYAEEAEPEAAVCDCDGDRFEVAVGYALYEDGKDVRWVNVALRCVEDGLMGIYADWKIGYGPSLHLLEQA